MSPVIIFSTLINRVTNENRLWKTWNFPWHVTKKEMNHLICLNLKIFKYITKATFNNRKFMNNPAFVVPIHVCLPRDTWSLRGVGGKKKKSWTRSEELQGLTSCTQGRRIFYCPHGICFRGLHRKHCFKMEWVLLLLLYGTKSRENNGPNGQPT